MSVNPSLEKKSAAPFAALVLFMPWRYLHAAHPPLPPTAYPRAALSVSLQRTAATTITQTRCPDSLVLQHRLGARGPAIPSQSGTSRRHASSQHKGRTASLWPAATPDHAADGMFQTNGAASHPPGL